LCTAACPISGHVLSPACCQPFCLSSLCLLKVHAEISSLPSPFLWCPYSTPSPLLYVPFQFLVYCSVIYLFIIFVGQGVSLSGGYVGLSQGWLWEYHMSLGVHLLAARCPQAGLEVASGGAVSLLFSQCNVSWRSFPQARGLGCQSFDSSWCFFSVKCGSCISARFLIYGAHPLLLHSSHHLVSS
jgi:hypothetical protein